MFVEELRARREQMGLLQREFAEKAHLSLSSVKQYEAGKKKPGRPFATWCDDFYGCPGTFERLYDGMIAESYPSWFGPRVLFEDKATRIHEWEMRGIPGLLQTRSYASAVIRACRPYDAGEELERDAAARIERQNILTRDDPPKLWVVLSEGVLRQAVGGVRVMRDQLGHLLSLAEAQGIVLQVLPFAVTDAPGVDGPAALFEFEDSPAVAYLEGWGSGRVLKDPKEVAAIATALSMVKGCALSPIDSAQLMTKIRSEL
jgi:transcriptional regulator with XRE-family HTH domain